MAIDTLELLRDSLPEPLLRGLAHCVFDVCRAAAEKVNHEFAGPAKYRCGPYSSPESHDLVGHVRKAMLEAAVRDLAEINDVYAVPRPSKNGTCFHTVLVHGAVVLTAHHVNHPKELPRPAEFRCALMRGEQYQTRMFPDDRDQREEAAPLLDDPHYAFLLYGTSTDPRVPLFAHIAFPFACRDTGKLIGYRNGRLDLFGEFPEIVEAKLKSLQSGGDEIVDDTQLRMRQQKRKKG